MFTPTSPIRKRALAWLAAALAAVSLVSAHGSAAAQSQSAYSQPELDRMLAPIALYPDPLLSQILMAATYPVEVVQAARWSRAHLALQGDAAVRAVEDEDWDPSVKSLVAFPNVLARMDEDLEWTRQLGDAFLDQEAQVMDTVQALRRRARAAGSLASDARIRVVDDGRTLTVEPVEPSIVYVPYYDPRVAYGAWWWPTYPPVVWAPWPGYAVRYPHSGVAVGFFWGPAVRISVGFFFGAIDWPRREVRVVSVTNYYYRPVIVQRTLEVHRHVVVAAPGPWRHEPHHRRGVSYRTSEVQHRYAPTPTREVHRSAERRPEAAPPHIAPRTQPTPSAPTTRSVRSVPSRDARTEARRDTPPQDQHVARSQPGGAAPRPTTPGAAPNPQSSVTPAVNTEPARSHAQDRGSPAATPGAAAPAAATPAPTPRDVRGARGAPETQDARRGDARGGSASGQDRRADPRPATVDASSQRGSDKEHTQRGQRRPPEPQVEQQRRPRRDDRTQG